MINNPDDIHIKSVQTKKGNIQIISYIYINEKN